MSPDNDTYGEDVMASHNADSGRVIDPANVMLQAEVAKRLGVSVNTLAYWRRNQRGPAYFRLGPRKIAYLRSDVETWLAREMAATYHLGDLAPNGSSGMIDDG